MAATIFWRIKRTTEKMFGKMVTSLRYPFSRIGRLSRGLWTLQHRERVRLRDEMSETQRLVPLLMKQRNGTYWTDEERHEIQQQLRRMALLSPYLILFVMPGGLFLLPLLAWWMDRRRLHRKD